ncbi:MAG: DUF3047 domain-containing protein [Pseudomonadota bacterium]
MIRIAASLVLAATLALPGLATPGSAEGTTISFLNGSWAQQRFLFKRSNDYAIEQDTLTIDSYRSVSILYSRLPESLWNARGARWDWAVLQSAPATDLTSRGGDDRNIAVYFIFLPPDRAQATRNRNIRRLLNEPSVRALAYVWGGRHEAGSVLPSPYMDNRGVTIVQRPAGVGQFTEEIDLAADFRRAFGSEPTALAGLAISADTDDTRSMVQARLSSILLR